MMCYFAIILVEPDLTPNPTWINTVGSFIVFTWSREDGVIIEQRQGVCKCEHPFFISVLIFC